MLSIGFYITGAVMATIGLIFTSILYYFHTKKLKKGNTK